MSGPSESHDNYIRSLLAAESSLRGYILAHVRNFDMAEDILQETSIALWRKFELYDPQRPFLSWAIGVARLEIQKALRASGQSKTIFDSELADLVAESYAAMQAELSDRREALRDCVGRLRGATRLAIELRYDEERALDAIGEKMGKSLAAVKVLLHRARLAIEECVKLRLQAKEA